MWIHFGTLIASEPQRMNKNREFEYAAVEITQYEHRLSYTPGVVRLKEKLKVTSADPQLLLKSQPFTPVQHILGGQSYQAFFPLFAYIQVQEPGWITQVARAHLNKRAG